MKLKLIIIEFLIYATVGIILSVSIFYIGQSRKINKETINSLDQLKKVSDNKKYKINSYISGVKNEIEGLAMMEETKDILKQKLVSGEQIVKTNIDQGSIFIIKEIENYIKRNPNKTFSELQNDVNFQKITGQIIGFDGSISIENITEIKDKNTSGFYNFREKDGKITKKYFQITNLGIKTADNIGLVVIISVNVDDYKISEEAVRLNLKYFEGNILKKDFGNLFLINPDGYIVYESKIDEHLGTNVKWDINKDLILAKSSVDIYSINGVVFSDAYLESYGELYPKFLIISPVYDQNKLLGYVVLSKKMNVIFEITENNDNLGQTGKSYLVSEDKKTLISPLENSNFDMFVQDINTQNVNNCFNNQENIFGAMVGYDGENVLGVHTKILETNWCLLTEIKEKSILEINWQREIILSIIIFIIYITLGIIKMIRQIKGSGKIKVVIFFEKFMAELKLGYGLVFSLIISFWFSFGFNIESWSGFWLNKTFYLFSLFVLMMVFFYGFKIKNELSKKMVTCGIMLAFLARIVLTLSQQNFFEKSFRATALWTAASMLGFIGMLLFFYGFIGVIKNHDN